MTKGMNGLSDRRFLLCACRGEGRGDCQYESGVELAVVYS